MSYQRAVVNCKRCYSLATMAGVSQANSDSAIVSISSNDRVWQARNEALRAVEELIADSEKSKLLNACMNCKFECPIIARLSDDSGCV